MALIGKAGRQGDLGQRQLGISQQLLDMIQPPAQQVTVRRHSYGLVEGAREMISRESCHGREGIEADLLVKMRFDVIANAAREAGRQPAAPGGWRFSHRQMAQGVYSWAGVDNCFRPVAPRDVFA